VRRSFLCRLEAESLDEALTAKRRTTMQQNKLYLVIGALLVIVIGLGIYVLRQETKPEGVELRIDDSGISVQQK
jgi:RsiW-degrading membrane proteinase PrsW (M82 family)